ncbi:MAG TPA: hypothetical protein VG387_22075 [Rhizomicrobium sp.]|jgi:hypothetical protein|nr:hypothetical protein [Rhizomicrobium sp.]
MRPVLELLVALAVVVALYVWVSRRKGPPAYLDIADKDFVPDPANTVSVATMGWTREELDQIVAGFRGLYEMPLEPAWCIAEAGALRFTITFPDDIGPTMLIYLVNYIQYPREVAFEERTVGVLGHATIAKGFNVNPTLLGKRAQLYVPANDTEYDAVYAQVEGGGAYRISIGDNSWQPASDPRLPANVAGL